ncbi:MAG TPA: methylmalonyl Co-A mutase-associated GTPase MeaB [Edaphocola sp.]|nr:methylmalonyl Co-A mutase-associated GTPase MeaB [Edaphocola sp.]
MRPLPNIEKFKEGILSGNIALLSRAITLVESERIEHKRLATQLLDSILPFAGNAMRIGITGVPGVGKSTFIEVFGMHLINQGQKVAVLAIDPSSSVSKGSILGDKTRMEKLSVNHNAFIRPTASGGNLGGLSYKTREVSLLCEAAGFNTIIIETVGVGQSETEVHDLCDFFLLLMLAGAGDELQGIKRGIMEMADGLVINKADGENVLQAKIARAEYARSLHFLPSKSSGWQPEVLITSAIEQIGIPEVAEMIAKFKFVQQKTGQFEQRRKEQNLKAFNRLLQEVLYRNLLEQSGLGANVEKLKDDVSQGKLNPYSAIVQLFPNLQ